MFGKKFILKRLPNIWEEKSSSSCTRHFYHYVSDVYIWEEIYSEICTNICEENSSESCNWYWEESYSEICTNIWEEISSESFTWYCYHYVSYFIIWEEIYSENCTNVWGENCSESCTWHCYHWACWVSYFYICEEIYSEITANLLILNVFVFAKKLLLKLYFVSCYCHGAFYFSKSVILFSVWISLH